MALMPRLNFRTERGGLIEHTADLTVTEDSTPLGVEDTSGSTGDLTITFDRLRTPGGTLMAPRHWKSLKGQHVSLVLGGGIERPVGIVSHVSGGTSTVSVAVDSIATKLSVTRSVKPHIGRLDTGIKKWAAAVGIPGSSVQVASSLAARQVQLVGFYDSIWLKLKQLAAALEVEVIVRDEAIVVRPPRSDVLELTTVSDFSWDVDDTTMAQEIDVAYYSPHAYTTGADTPDFSRQNVDSDPDDPFDIDLVVGNSRNGLPPGYTKRSTVSDS